MLLVSIALLISTVKPEIWAPGVISTELDEFGGALTPDGQEFYFSVSVPRYFLECICVSKKRNDKWNVPQVMPWSGVHHEFDPCLSPDGKRLFFISDRPIHGEKKTDYDVWMLERRGKRWSDPIHLPEPVNSPGSEHFASCAANGDLFVCSDRDGKSNKVYRIPYAKGKYGSAQVLPDEVNGEGSTLESSISPDGQILVSAIIGRKDSRGLYDIYISFRAGDGWTPMKPLGPEINSPARDYTPRISTDGKWLFYASERGFATEKRSRPLTFSEMNQGCASLLNGYGNIYRVKFSDVLEEMRR